MKKWSLTGGGRKISPKRILNCLFKTIALTAKIRQMDIKTDLLLVPATRFVPCLRDQYSIISVLGNVNELTYKHNSRAVKKTS